ncbi:histidine phosphatase family protein [Nocardioides aurantiacus]|uniref:Broad specificity phosphatase PhoE n=1 Tax=Nocardioides aurantiacus TaxID=86796 RepID=A0A3N2CWI7_9ACTN|nr:histidine phosphatase family protein [Nocardioides aurantiacus]ROR91901.1 broad specificity phosphatase PhoE [Nocardioides aurantiacus]
MSAEATRTVVHLLRHGEVHNPDGVLYGRAPGFGLSDAGRAMAVRAADLLAGRDVTALVSSPLERALETAGPVADRLGLGVRLDDRLVEVTNVFEGRRVDMNRSILAQPRVWRALWNPWRPSWGEPYRDVVRRMAAAVDEARATARGHEVVLVSHQVPIWVTRRRAEGRRPAHLPRRREVALGSLTSLHFLDDRLTGVTYADPALGHGLPVAPTVGP